MMQCPDPTDPPNAEMLAAYADDELTAAQRERIEEWLAKHPAGAEEVRTLRRLRDLCRDAVPPEPSEAAWSALLARIELGVARAGETRRSRGGRVWPWAAAGAAAVLLALLLLPGKETRKPPEPTTFEAYPMVSDTDVEIVSIAIADVKALVVGRPPLCNAVVLVEPGDIAVTNMDSDVHMRTGSDEKPMIISPLAANYGRDSGSP